MVKTKRPGFISQHSHSSSQLSVTPVLGDPISSKDIFVGKSIKISLDFGAGEMDQQLGAIVASPEDRSPLHLLDS